MHTVLFNIDCEDIESVVLDKVISSKQHLVAAKNFVL